MLCSAKTMKMYTSYVVIAILATSWCSAIPKPDEHNKREVHKQLSDEDHELDGDHNSDYDHDAFLGEEEAKSFDQLTPEESREKLGIIVNKIDKDQDGSVTEQELKEWIQYVQKRYVVTDTDRMWKDHDVENDHLIWESYQKRTYGYTDDPEEGSPTHSYKDMIVRDRRRWEAADKDKDNLLTKEEFMDFMHPEEAEHMRDIVVKETIEDIDKDQDGFISLEEYIEDVYDEEDEDDEDDEDNGNEHGEPEWVQSEREQFHTYRDKNGDGKLDHDEVEHWIIPEDYDHIEAESSHLMAMADEDKDGKLSKEEILDKFDLFVGSQATDFGEALMKHDEF